MTVGVTERFILHPPKPRMTVGVTKRLIPNPSKPRMTVGVTERLILSLSKDEDTKHLSAAAIVLYFIACKGHDR